MTGLTKKQKRFCEEYLIDLNGTQAAIRAGYSEKTAKEIACENLTKPHIRAYIDPKLEKVSNKLEISIERVLQEYARIAFFDIRKLYDENGRLKEITELDEDTARAIGGVDLVIEKSSENNIIDFVRKIKVIDKKGALDSLGKYLNMFVDRVEHSGGVKVIQDDIK